MTQIDEIRLVTDLEPALLDRLARDGYARRRDGDLARALAAGPGRARPPRRSPVAVGSRRGALLTGGIAATAVAAAAVAVIAQAPPSRPRYLLVHQGTGLRPDYGRRQGAQGRARPAGRPQEGRAARQHRVRRAARLHGGELDGREPRPHDHEPGCRD